LRVDYVVFGIGGSLSFRIRGRFRCRRGGRIMDDSSGSGRPTRRGRIMDDSSGSGRPSHVHSLASYHTTTTSNGSNGNGLDASNLILIILLNFGTVDSFEIPMKFIFILNR
jgi:hypothetical protein